MRFGLVLRETFSNLWHNVSMSISVILVTFISLTFVGSAILMQNQISLIDEFWSSRAQVAVYMCSEANTTQPSCAGGGATEEQIAEVQSILDGPALSPLIREVSFETSEQAYENAVEFLDEGLASMLSVENMNATFWISLNDQSQTDVITEAFQSRDGVQEVSDQMRYLEPLFSALSMATVLAIFVAGLMLIATVLLVATTIRLSAKTRETKVEIMRVVGASNGFIKLPFILEGVLAAFFGSVLASVAILFGVRYGVEDILKPRIDFVSTWVGMDQAWAVVPILILISVVLAAVSAAFAIRRRLLHT